MLPSGTFFTRHEQEAAYLRTRPQRLWLAAFLTALVALPLIAGNYIVGFATVVFITLIAVLGLQITTGMAGQLNLGQSAFVGFGAFVAAKLSSIDIPFWAVIPLAGFATATASVVFGLPAVRVKGFYLALTTFAAQVIFPIMMIRLPDSWFGGSSGLPVETPRLFGQSLGTPTAMYYLTLLAAVVCTGLVFNLDRTRVGRAFRALRDNDIAASVLGIDPLRYKVMAFFAGALFAGVAGALYAYYIRYVTTEQFTLWQSVWYVGMLLVGGMLSPLGAILGTVFISGLQELLHVGGGLLLAANSGLTGGFIFAATNVMLGALIILALIFEPYGLAHRWNLMKAAYRIWPYPHG
ncbi:MAG: branched-chain amino acid ABC transporter permease [Rhodospirillales bacterium]|nr:branched-chain amino acid ABC transporter permease [Rhodospirillales bacterium]